MPGEGGSTGTVGRWATRRVSARTRATYAELRRAGRPAPGLARRRRGFRRGRPAGGRWRTLADSDAFTAAARDRRAYLLTVAKAAPATVHVSLAALAALGECLGRGAPDVARVDRPARAPRALGEDEVRRLLRAARRTRRDPGPGAARAVLSGTGLRPAEAAALDVDDVPTTERTGAVHVRAGKGERPRTVPLPTDDRRLLRRWLTERARHPAARRGRLSARQLQRIIAPARRRRPAGGRQRVHPVAHRGDPMAARRRRRRRGRRSTWSRFPRRHSDVQPGGELLGRCGRCGRRRRRVGDRRVCRGQAHPRSASSSAPAEASPLTASWALRSAWVGCAGSRCARIS